MQLRIAGRDVLRTAGRAAVLSSLLALAACAAEEERGERFVSFPEEAKTIDLAETDLALPLDSPLEIRRVRERIGEGRVLENVYSFVDVKGYLRSSRVFFGHYSDNTSRSLRHQGFFEAFARDDDDRFELGPVHRFQSDDPHTQGFYAYAGRDGDPDECFIARVGYLLVDYASVEREADSVDTLVQMVLCGDLPRTPVLLDFLAKVRKVEDRDAYRRALSKSTTGTI